MEYDTIFATNLYTAKPHISLLQKTEHNISFTTRLVTQCCYLTNINTVFEIQACVKW